jgi:hypothetical protein
MEKTTEQTPAQTDESTTEVVLPRTLGIRQLTIKGVDGAADTIVHGVYGGASGEVWCATFFDEPEAQAWIIASNSFGEAVRGKIMPAAAIPKIQLQ